MPFQADSTTCLPCPNGWLPLTSLQAAPLSIEKFLQIALGICDALIPLQRTEGCYGLLSPDTVCIGSAPLQVGLAPADACGLPPERTVRAMPYLTPEQSGRIGRRVDARSDCYSLGVVSYELLTGALPFEAHDALEWMHAHMARMPQPPHIGHPRVPLPLSDIVMKMLDKTPDRRYQSAAGLHADLAQCWRQWQASGTIAPFPIGRQDIGARFQTPHGLYGRARESACLAAAWTRVEQHGTSELIILSGPAGVGKSALVEALERQVLARGGTLVAGKFDQDKRRTPFSAACRAMSQLVDAVLAGDDEALRAHRARLLAGLDGNGALLFELLPGLRLVLGDQPALPVLPAREAQLRFFAALGAVIAAFATPDHPLVLFLDDLHWADDDTLAFLMFLLVDTRTPDLLVIGACRDIGLATGHPLARAVERARGASLPVTDITLRPLSATDFVPLIADVLDIPQRRARPLAALVRRKTGGIPLFALHFLDRLERDGLLRHDAAHATWTWDPDTIQAQSSSDNVVDLLLDALSVKLPDASLDKLRYAACIGHVVDLAFLARVCGDTQRDLRAALREPLRAGFVELADRGTLRFAHDRIRQAVHALIPSARRRAMHLEIARCLRAVDTRGEHVFDIADHVNLGGTDGDERSELVVANLRAGVEAKQAGAHAAAAHYLDMGLRGLRPGDFDSDYQTASALHYELAHCRYLLGRTSEALALLDVLLAHAHGVADQARALDLKIELLSARADNAGALMALRACASLFGITLPDHPTEADAAAEEARFWAALGDRPIAALAEAPARDADDPHEYLLDSMLIATPQANVHSAALRRLLSAHAANLSLRHGSRGAAALSYALLGIGSAGRDDNARTAALADAALRLVEGVTPPVSGRYRAPVLLVAGAFLAPLTRPLRAGLAHLHAAFDAAQRSAETFAANLACEYIIEQRCAAGDPLAELLQDIDARIDFAGHTPYAPTRQVLEAWRAHVRRLRGADTPDEQAFEKGLEAGPASPAHFIHFSLQSQARFLSGDHDGALRAATRAAAYERFAPCTIQRADLHFYRALAAAARYRSAPGDEPGRAEALGLVRAACDRFAKWRTCCAENYAARHDLLCAERARIDGDGHAAMAAYARAIEGAAAQQATQVSALAHELAADFCREHDAPRLARTLLDGALADYARWGADAKVDQLRRREVRHDGGVPAPARTADANVDLLAMAKAAQAIANEVTTGRVHETLLRTLLEHVGAERAHLLVYNAGMLLVRESARYDNDRFQVEHRPDLPPSHVPDSVVQYVARTRMPLSLDDACREGAFAHDARFHGLQQCAVLCLPILRQRELAGVLYLENTRLAGAFARVNVQVLEWLLAQVAISMENAALYENLQESEARLATVMDHVPACVYMKDLEARYLFVNRAFEKTFGVVLADTLHKTDFDHFADAPEVAEAIYRTDMMALREGTMSIEEDMPGADGQPHTFLSVKTPLYGNDGVRGLCGISMDISEQKRARERIEYLARYDLLTGLVNRHLLDDSLNQAIAEARRDGTLVGVMVLDLDRFKVINDSLGHRVGDRLLCEVAARLQACARPGDIVARLGGDEFAVVATGVADAAALRQSAAKIIDSLARPFRLDGREAATGASIGISVFPQDADTGEALVQYADLAMHDAKEDGRRGLRFYNDAMDLRAQERMTLETELRRALANRELFLLYQPQVDLRDRHVTGAEALVRWRHPARGVISPGLFIPLAEECGLISEITLWAIGQACAQLRQWRDAGLPPVSLAVNVTASNVLRDDLLRTVESALAGHGLDGACFELEVTEGTLMKDMDTSIEKLMALKRLGIRLSIDDFGTGYSSLSYLKRLPVDKLKIDQSFVRDIARDPDDAAITGAIIAMGKQLNLKVIAEGVEDRDAERFLLQHRCDQMQGYLFSPPVPADVFSAMLS